ncbi:MAG: hypothetical protein MUF59_01415 [Candidatus Krumholzibacteria bacterium]|nr:hypothetical protein [Candidatus Krumholzibacteria bacterium]
MKRLAVLLLAVSLASGCKSTLRVNNQSDPKDFAPIDLPGGGYTGSAFAELEYSVPEELSNEEFDIVRVDIFGDVFVEEIAAAGEMEIEIDIYLGLEAGEEDLDDPEINTFLTTITISDPDERHHVEISNPRLLEKGLRQGRFFIKVEAEIITNPTTGSDPRLGVLRITDIYFNAFLERETSGLLAFLNMF